MSGILQAEDAEGFGILQEGKLKRLQLIMSRKLSKKEYDMSVIKY